MKEENENQEKQMSREEVHAAIEEVIKEVQKSRDVAREASKNGLKRNPFETLEERGLMNADYIIDEFDKIQAKASSHPSGEREVINKIMLMALHKVAKAEYERENQNDSNNNQKSEDNEK